MWYCYTTICLIAAISGKYREVERQAQPEQNIADQIEIQVPEIVQQIAEQSVQSV
jgi:hypothetical protein